VAEHQVGLETLWLSGQGKLISVLWYRVEKHQGITEVVKPFDWSYTTDYKGTLSPSPTPQFTPTTNPIPLELLRRPDPILFFDEVMLYEDEMADNGITMLSCKLRVMPARLLLLCRFFMRLDNVLFRMRDTRVYIEFATGKVIREYTEKEEDYESVRMKLATGREDVLAVMRDPNRLAEILPIVNKTLEECVLE
jgi:type 2A phosphatase activator TIP41